MPNLTLDLFADPEPAPVSVLTIPKTGEDFTACPHCGGDIEKCYEWPCDECAVGKLSTVTDHIPGFWASKLQEMGEMRLLAARSFIEIARRSGIEHEALAPTGTDINGQKTYDMGTVTRLANKMRGRPESLKPELKTEADWQAAIEGVKLWKLAHRGGKS